ncbi:MAG TPA: hypothetical protein VEO54_01435 [Thermoanaerobaculia bacterium]|nr:hypothetical protein [Thermoanaerobaculia bacterium]
MRTIKGLSLLLLLVCLTASAQDDVPLKNWSVPAQGKVTTNTNGTTFVGITPCRLVDTRFSNGPFSGPAFSANETRTYDVAAGPCTEAAFAAVYSLSFTLVNYNPAASGYVTAFPAGVTMPPVSTVNFGSGVPVANAAIVASGAGGAISVYASAATHLIIDVNGYFIGAAQSLPPAKVFQLTGTVSNGGVIMGRNATSVSGFYTTGVLGHVTDLTLTDASGVMGYTTSGVTWGVKGFNGGTTGSSGGVLGIAGARPTATTFGIAGVRGESKFDFGVLGMTSNSNSAGIQGVVLDAQGNILRGGNLGTNAFGVWSMGNTGASGTKSFVDPHPTDPTKVVRFISLEGPEAGTYFRGRGRFVRGKAVIEVPEAFRITTEEEGLTVHITPMGQPAMVAVTRQSLAVIEATATRDVEFSYVVYGVRRGYKDFQPIDDGTEFIPETANAKIPAYLNESQKQRLIDNGTYNVDGTVNLATAVRLGWEKGWAEREKRR